jgi:hypothetical protein
MTDINFSYIKMTSTLLLKLSISGNLAVFILSETYNLIAFLKICAACSRLSCFVFFFKSSVMREEIVFVNFKNQITTGLFSYAD